MAGGKNMLTILILLISTALAMNLTASAQADLVKKVCADNPDCAHILGSDPRTRTAKDLMALADILLDLAISNTTHSVEFLEKMARDPTTSPKLKPVLQRCVENYKSPIMEFRIAKTEIKSSVEGASYDIAIATDGPAICRSDMEEHGFGNITEISVREKYVQIFSNIGGTITDLMG